MTTTSMDDELRDLERRARQGDDDAFLDYAVACLRLGRPCALCAEGLDQPSPSHATHSWVEVKDEAVRSRVHDEVEVDTADPEAVVRVMARMKPACAGHRRRGVLWFGIDARVPFPLERPRFCDGMGRVDRCGDVDTHGLRCTRPVTHRGAHGVVS